MQTTSDSPVGLSTVIVGSSWDVTVYDELREFHQGKGFDPDSQDVVRHLRYPLYQLSNDTFHPEESHSDCDSNMASTDDSEEAPTSVENGSEHGHDSSNMTASARGHAELPASESAGREEEADPSSLHGDPLAVPTTLRFLMHIQLALILFLAVSWLYDRMQRDGRIFSFKFNGIFYVL
ncbi:hypothetical protein DFH08DRAFT_243751 [Mycena albidolilacea]|uniref:Uncharacterized protein n=1 Tax=Mycena albidolilacea TaxID=1033008 RepID=A0AAD6ZUZ9_9AGAR|nr:hypothetical protein DFH08DRAFT_243751 [Mycena albidolilacea]